MAQLISVRLSRVDAQPWGLRLQGGKDFGTPLVIQKVNMGSIADNVGLIAGDSVIKVNNVDVYGLRHKDAQDIIVRSGNSFEITVQRGGSTWKPSVVPTGNLPQPSSYGNQINTVTKTSLAHKQPDESQHIGCGYNNAARPFGNQNGGPVQSIVNKQYNTPVGMYSEESIAETLSAQAEVLAGGVLGVNFKKNEKVYNSAGSEVLKALQEAENDPPEPDEPTYRSVTPLTKHVSAPADRPIPPSTGGLPSGQNICAECERLIVGVFVRIKDKNLHVDCFKCATCGTSLKNQGYFNLNNKLYCDIHAKMAAINNPPPGTEGYRPVPIQPNTKLSASTISAALNIHHGNQNGTLNSNIGAPKPYNFKPNQPGNPPMGGQRSPSSYASPNNMSAWAQTKSTYASPKPTNTINNYSSNTLPRAVGKPAPGRYNTLKPGFKFNRELITHENTNKDNYDDEFAEEMSRPSTSNFSWPPPPEEDHTAPTASPLYIPPPGTQHIKCKPFKSNEIFDNKLSCQWPKQQNYSAPELTTLNVRQHNEMESCSEGYTSTCTTTTTATSEDYQRMYQAHIGAQSQFIYDQSMSDIDNGIDTELNAMQFQQASHSSTSTDFMSFSNGRRSVQECTDSLLNTVNTCQLVNYLKELTPVVETPAPKSLKKVEFSDELSTTQFEQKMNDTYSVKSEKCVDTVVSSNSSKLSDIKTFPPSNIPNPVPKEWTSMMVQALTTVSNKPYHISDLPKDCVNEKSGQECEQQIYENIDNNKKTCEQSYKKTDTCIKNTTENNLTNDSALTKGLVNEIQDDPISGSFMTSALTIAAPDPVTWTRPLDESVPLPEERNAYLPPPISMTPIEKEDLRTKSPFLKALITAPDTSYTPFERDVITQLDDLPNPTEELRLIDALTVAPINSYGKFNPELPAITESEQIALDEANRLEKQALEVKEIITNTIESQMDRQLSAFAKVTGFRSVNPFKPKILHLETSTLTQQSNTLQDKESINQNLYDSSCQQIFSEHNVESTACVEKTQVTSNVSFPPPLGVKAKSYVQSGLHKPETIPKYQRQWFNLPSQSPIRTPEPHELKENIPLAFIDVHHEASCKSENELNAFQTVDSGNNKFTDDIEQKSECINKKSTNTIVPVIADQHAEKSVMTFKSLDAESYSDQQRQSYSLRPHTPSLINKPAPTIPYYQQNLVAEKCTATSSHLYDPHLNTPSPCPDRAKSPAPGPPPNPLRIQAPRIKSPEIITETQSELKFPFVQTEQSTFKESQVIPFKASDVNSNNQVLSQHKYLHQSGSKSFRDTPEIVQQKHVGNMNIQTRSKESELKEQNRTDFQSSTTTQCGNTQVQRRRRVVEEYEHSQKAKTVEIYKSTGGSVKMLSDQVAIKDINNSASLTQLKQNSTSKTSNSSDQLKLGKVNYDHGYGRTAALGESRRLSTNSQYKTDLAAYESCFPQIASPTPQSSFPIKNFHPIMEEPKEQNYNISLKSKINQNQAAINNQQIQSKTNLIPNTTSSSNNHNSQTQSRSLTITPITTTAPVPVSAFKLPLSIANESKPSPNAGNFKPTSSSGSGFKPPNKNPSAVVSNPSPASAGLNKGLTFGATSAPKRGRGIINRAVGPGGRVPQCGCCHAQIRGPFITALGRIWCPDHFVCVNANCRRPLQDIGFVEEKGDLYCEYCFEKYLAPPCDRCGAKIKGDCLNAIGKHYHPECFTCTYCGKLFGNSPFFLEEGQAYCETDWNELFTTKCFACGFPVEAGDRWVEALSHNYHSQCFNCTMCKKNLEGQSFYAKSGRPYCKNHAR